MKIFCCVGYGCKALRRLCINPFFSFYFTVLLTVFALSVPCIGFGQAYNWVNAWSSLPTYHTGSCAPEWNYTNTGACNGLYIRGNASSHWSRWDNLSGTLTTNVVKYVGLDGDFNKIYEKTNLAPSSCNNSFDGYYYYEYSWNVNEYGRGYTRKRKVCRDNNGGSGIYGWDTDETITVPLPTTGEVKYPNVATYPPQHLGADGAPHDDDSIYVTASGVYSSFSWNDYNWSHTFTKYYLDTLWNGLDVELEIKHVSETTGNGINTLTDGTVTKSAIKTPASSSVRLTGSPQFVDNTTSPYFINNASKFFFDSDWDGLFTGIAVSGVWGNMQTLTGGQTLGYNGAYTNNVPTAVTGGTLAFGSAADQRNVNITSATPVKIDAYNCELVLANENGCAPKSAADVGFDAQNATTVVDADLLQITNSNKACYAVNFDIAPFMPTFNAVSGGRLLIDPNITNFLKGATVVNNASAAGTSIISKMVNVTGDFTHEGTADTLSFLFKHQGADCAGCGVLSVSGSFGNTNNQSSRLIITDAGGDNAHVSVVGDYVHNSPAANASSSSNVIDVFGEIAVGGKTLLTAGNDTVAFISRGSQIILGTAATDTTLFDGRRAGNSGTGVFRLEANGVCTSGATNSCAAATGDVVINGVLVAANETVGSTSIVSKNHLVLVNDKLTYNGSSFSDTYTGAIATADTTNATLSVYGKTGVEVTGAANITTDSAGHVAFISYNGHIDFKDTLNYTQSDLQGNDMTRNGLSVVAKGLPTDADCNGQPGWGYVRIQKPFKTTTLEHGRVEVVSTNQKIIIDDSIVHHGVEGNYDVIARGSLNSPQCETNKLLLPVTMSNDRGYVHVGKGVRIDLDSVGNVTFQSENDVVQFDGDFEFNNNGGKAGDLYVDGKQGVRSRGAVITRNPQYISLLADGSPIAHDDYKTATFGTYNTVNDDVRNTADNGVITYLPGSGNVRYHSEDGFVDFLGAFTHEAPEDTSRLTVQGKTRVKFDGVVDVAMTLLHDTTPGEAFIYSDGGYIDFRGNTRYASRDADLRVWAKGNKATAPSCVDSSQCAPVGGHVRFADNDVRIDFSAQTALSPEGRTWIKSYHDDILFDNANLQYLSSEGANNGMFWLQAGQDVLARGKTNSIRFTSAGDKSIVWEAQGSIRTQQSLYFDRSSARSGNIVLKSGYNYTTLASSPVYDVNIAGNSAPQTVLNWTKSSIALASPPSDYTHRYGCDDNGTRTGSDLWFQGSVDFDMSATAPMTATDSSVSVLLRAVNSVYFDSAFTYRQAQKDLSTGKQYDVNAGWLRVFAENGNIEAINSPATQFNVVITEAANSSEVRLQAGNDPDTPSGCSFGSIAAQTDGHGSHWEGNILFNKPLNVTSAGVGAVTLLAERDIENQQNAPFTFNFNSDSIMQPLLLSAGRHLETHSKTSVNYLGGVNQRYGQLNTAQLVFEAGRINDAETGCAANECKTAEYGTALTYKPTDYRNDFAQGGAGHGSILFFDSVEISYDGLGDILFVAENGNIESDPYLHRGSGSGYKADGTQHEAQITVSHGGKGSTTLKAIDIRLHDRITYNATAATGGNGQFSLLAYDSILTRNIVYRNPYDNGNVYITADKYKSDACALPASDLGANSVHSGHIVLGYGADSYGSNSTDSIVFDFNSGGTNTNTTGGNVYITAGQRGFTLNPVTGKRRYDLFPAGKDRGKGYGGNITFDYMEFSMPTGNANTGGYVEISTPNGNIWGKDSIVYHGVNGNLLIDAGLGSVDDPQAILWGEGSPAAYNGYDILNTSVEGCCQGDASWRTGNIMLKGAHLTFSDPQTGQSGLGNAVFRTREGFIDTYDAFTAENMKGALVKYAALDNATDGAANNYGSIAERDFSYTPVAGGGSVYYGADNNLMFNYGNSNEQYVEYGGSSTPLSGFPGQFNVSTVNKYNAPSQVNPYYYTPYEGYIENLRYATFNVNTDGFQFYRVPSYQATSLHKLFRGCKHAGGVCSPLAGQGNTAPNAARDLTLAFINSGGFAAVAGNYIDFFTKFTYKGGVGAGLGKMPLGAGTLHGENVASYGLFIKSQYHGVNDNMPEKRRATCEECGNTNETGKYEMTYIGFHDDARIHTEAQKSLLEAPVIEFFGHAELNTYANSGSASGITLKTDSLIFHDSVIIDGTALSLVPYTTTPETRNSVLSYGIVNDRNNDNYNSTYGQAITMTDRNLPVIELGYQRCIMPDENGQPVAEPSCTPTPQVGGDVIVAFKHGYRAPRFNTIVANHARISFMTDLTDGVYGGEYYHAFFRTDLLRIRNKVEFYTDPDAPNVRSGALKLATPSQMTDEMYGPGMFTQHLHLEPGSELSLSDQSTVTVQPYTVVGGFGTIHEDIFVLSKGIVAPGFASLMESDCLTPELQDTMRVHNLQMEKDAEFRVSFGYRNGIPATDVLDVRESVFLGGSIPVRVLNEPKELPEGRFLILKYGDKGMSSLYVRNLELQIKRYGDTYFSLDFSNPGEVYLMSVNFTPPVIQRAIKLPKVEGVTTTPGPGTYFVEGHQDFSFNVKYSAQKLKVTITNGWSYEVEDIDHKAVLLSDGSYQFTLYQVVNPWDVNFGPELFTDNELVSVNKVWSYRNSLYINSIKDDVVSVYTMAGVLYRQKTIPPGITSIDLERGVYTVTLKDGAVHKIIIK
jgi:hypothetical protein